MLDRAHSRLGRALTRPRDMLHKMPSWMIAVATAASAVDLARGPGVVAPVVLIALGAAVTPGRSWVHRAANSILLIGGVIATLMTIAALFSFAVPVRPVMAISIVCLGSYAMWIAWKPRARVPWTSAADLWALLNAGIVFAVFYRPFVGATPGRIIGLLSRNTDIGTHLQLALATLRHGGYVMLLGPGHGLSQGMVNYPPAVAGYMAFVLEPSLGRDPASADFLRGASAFVIGIYVLLVWFATRASMKLLRYKRPGGAAASATCAIAILICSVLGFNAFLLQSGSLTLMVALAALLSCLVVIEGNDATWASLAFLGLVTVLGMQSWYLLGLPFAALWLLVLLRQRVGRAKTIGVGIAAGALTLYAVVHGPSPLQHLNTTGSTVFPSFTGLAALIILAGLVAGWLLIPRGMLRERQALGTVYMAALISIVLAVAVQDGAEAGFSYYAAKLGYVVFLLSVVAAGPFMVSLFQQAVESAGGRRTLFCAAAAAVVGLLAVSIGNALTTVLPMVRGRSPAVFVDAAADSYLSKHPYGLSPGHEAWIVNGCAPSLDGVASKWPYDLSLTWNGSVSSVLYAMMKRSVNDLEPLLAHVRHQPDIPVEIYTSRSCAPTELKVLARFPQVSVIDTPS